MKQLIIIAIAATFALQGCKKQEDCEQINTGTLHIHNQSSGPIDVIIDNINKATLQADEITDISNIAGIRELKVIEQNNPCSDFLQQIDINQCETTNIAYTADATCCQVNNSGVLTLNNTTSKLIIWRIVDVTDFANLYAGDVNSIDLPVGSNYHFVAYSPQGGSWELYFQIEQCQADIVNITN
jgi:hypothetical protein